MGPREMSIKPCPEPRNRVLKILILRSYYPSELIMQLLEKITKSVMLRSNKCSKGGLFFLNRPKCFSNVTIVSIGLL